MKRPNLFDAAMLVFVMVLIPVAYGTWMLFRTPHPTITSVTRVDITKEERRIGGANLAAKFKVRGSGLRPLLRATVGDMPAIALVFESPNSADLLVGRMASGKYDLVVYDGVQEVARAPKALTLDVASARRVTVRVRLDSPSEVVQLIKPGDHDWSLNPNRAVVLSVDKELLTVDLGAEALENGWRYFDDDLKPGVPFTLTTDTYLVKGTVLGINAGDKR